ncbi:MAG: transglutaminase family protein [Pseudomonadota bacterium]
MSFVPRPLPAEPGAASRPARYGVSHETRYAYASAVSQSWQLARLKPRSLPWQRLLSHALQIEPAPDECHEALDGFGNAVTHFGLHTAHRVLTVRMQSVLEVADRPALPTLPTQAWEQVRSAVHQLPQATDLHAALMTEATAMLPLSEPARLYAEPSLVPGRDWLDAVTELMHRIHVDFEFDPASTTVSTSVDEVLHQRRGVCQDFAHLMLAALRAHGLPARYVSGYLLTDPPAGQPRLVGVDASHAWVAAYSPLHGWVEFDPTNDQRADRRYITLAWGSDFADVVPVRGVILGGGEQEMTVSVNVLPLG